MKLLVAIVSKDDAEKTVSALTKADHRATRIDSVGGFWKEKNSTILVGVDAKKVSAVMKIIGKEAKSHKETLAPTPTMSGAGEFVMADPVEVSVGGATVFVLDVDQFKRL
jgi:uncharacterized protein YaaQ